MYGKKISEETKELIRQKLIGRKISQETIDKKKEKRVDTCIGIGALYHTNSKGQYRTIFAGKTKTITPSKYGDLAKPLIIMVPTFNQIL